MTIRRITTLLASLACAAALLSACESTPQVRSTTDPTSNLSSYRTYGFVAQPGTNRGGMSTPVTSYFETAISRELESRGFRKADANPDLLVNFNTNVREQADIRSSPSASFGYYGYRGGLYAGGNDVQTVRYKVGTANIDLADAAKRKLVWEGVAEGELTDDMMKSPQAAIDKVVAQMFMQFSGRAAP
ncbi:MAG TPA: DUF4136 domain-containing protein [Steroidobacteraceae bacterium]|nr:DUF4136 domain-containing protein [Steroidobacteraceae bacterium]